MAYYINNPISATNPTVTGFNGTSSALTANALEIKNGSNTILSIGLDGVITANTQSITISEWLTIMNVMKRFIMDISQDEELASKYPYIKDIAHTWFIEELKQGE